MHGLGLWDTWSCGGLRIACALLGPQRPSTGVSAISTGLCSRASPHPCSLTVSVLSACRFLPCPPSLQFNPVRVGFAWQGGTEVWTRDVLNLGVSPDKWVQRTAQAVRR